MASKIVVMGAGQAAIAFAAKLREMDRNCSITLVGDEPSLPYQRPPLSKKYLMGELDVERLLLRPAEWYRENGVNCLRTRRTVAILPDEMAVKLDDGGRLPFDKLLLATGASPRKLPASIGGELDRVYVLRNVADADAISPELVPGRRLLIIGGGYIGLEVAAVASTHGLSVRVTEMADRILQRVASPATSDIFRQLHSTRGVVIAENTSLAGLTRSEDGISAEFSDGSRHGFDFIIVAIGIEPNDQVASEAGLETDNGILVDETTRTSHPGIHAAGDCASFIFKGSRVRLESVQNAVEQAEIAALNIAGRTERYRPVPWFWSDQYDAKLQIAGLHLGYDRTLSRPGSHGRGQSVWYFSGERFVAVDAINDPRAYMTGKRLLEKGVPVTPTQAADPAFDLTSLLK